jgi:hypothetical protein
VLTFSYSLAGREEEARTLAAEILRINPKFSVDAWVNLWGFKNQADKNQFINGPRKAGLK